MLQKAILIFQYFLLGNLTLQVAYLLFFSIAGKICRIKLYPKAQTLRYIRIFIPTYKEDSVIIETVKNALSQNYPKALYEVVVIADSLNETTIKALTLLPVIVHEVSFEKSTKGKALQKAVELTAINLVDIVVIIDADNHMVSDFLHRVNNAFDFGYFVVQGHRTAKNPELPFAFLDACTEQINNNIFRRGHVAVGLPSALIGSGMAFEWNLFSSLINNIGETSGEDKELEFKIAKKNIDIAFLDGAFVYDEKVTKPTSFTKQRSRWLASQLEFFRKYFIEGFCQLFKGNIAFFNKVFQMYLLPRVLLVAMLLIWLFLVLLFSKQFLWYSISLFVSLIIALLLGIPFKWYNKHLLNAILQIPFAFLAIVKAIFNIRKAQKKFIHTPHGELETLK